MGVLNFSPFNKRKQAFDESYTQVLRFFPFGSGRSQSGVRGVVRRSYSEEPVPCWRSRGGKAVCGGVPGARQGALVSHRLACGPSHSSRSEKVKHELEQQVGVLELRTEALPRCPGMPADRGWLLRLRTTAWGGGVGPELCSLTWCSGSRGWKEQVGEGHIQGGHFPP